MADIMFAGIGGQGVLTAGKILIQIAAENGKNVSWTSEYSAEMRGGIALLPRGGIRRGNRQPLPGYAGRPGVHERGCLRYIYWPGGGRCQGHYQSVAVQPKGVSFPCGGVRGRMPWAFPAELNNTRGANLVMMGAMIAATQMMDKQQFL